MRGLNSLRIHAKAGNRAHTKKNIRLLPLRLELARGADANHALLDIAYRQKIN